MSKILKEEEYVNKINATILLVDDKIPINNLTVKENTQSLKLNFLLILQTFQQDYDNKFVVSLLKKRGSKKFKLNLSTFKVNKYGFHFENSTSNDKVIYVNKPIEANCHICELSYEINSLDKGVHQVIVEMNGKYLTAYDFKVT